MMGLCCDSKTAGWSCILLSFYCAVTLLQQDKRPDSTNHGLSP